MSEALVRAWVRTEAERCMGGGQAGVEFRGGVAEDVRPTSMSSTAGNCRLPYTTTHVEFEVIAERGRISISESPVRFELIRLGTPDPFGVDFLGSSKMGAPLPVSYPIPLPPHVKGTGLTIVEDLINAIETGQPPRCSGEDGRTALEIGVAMRESHRRGVVKVTLPLEDRSLKIIAKEAVGDEVPVRIRRQRAAEAR